MSDDAFSPRAGRDASPQASIGVDYSSARMKCHAGGRLREASLPAHGMKARVLRRGVSFLLLAFLAPLACAADEPAQPDRITIAIEALKRLKDVDLEQNPGVKAALMKVLDATKGTPQFVEIVRDFNLKGQEPALLEIALKDPGSS